MNLLRLTGSGKLINCRGSTMYNYYFGQEGDIIDENILSIFTLSNLDYRYNRELNVNIFDFVGVIIEDNNQLIVFPKHMYTKETISFFSNNPSKGLDGFKTVLNVVEKFILSKKSKARANDYGGKQQDSFKSSYPFEAFFRIYDYYEKYGIYHQKNSYISENGNGKYKWKKIIERSQPYLSDEGIVFIPLYRENMSNMYTIVSEAMAYIINETIRKFPYLTNMKIVDYISYNLLDFEENRYIINNLYNVLQNTYKDIDKELISNMIIFFEKKEIHAGNDEHLKIKYFNLIWQEMVHYYLNRHFVSANKNDLVFYPETIIRDDNYFTIYKQVVDESINKWYINIDHYHIDRHFQFIFDSKYYSDEKELNYKQIAYHDFMAKKYRGKNIITISALIFPGEDKVSYHYKTSEFLLQRNVDGTIRNIDDDVVIFSVKLNVIKVMKDYLLT